MSRVIDIPNSGRGAVQGGLHRLEVGGLVIVRMDGNQKHYQANHDSPLFDEIRSIVRITVGLGNPFEQLWNRCPEWSFWRDR